MNTPSSPQAKSHKKIIIVASVAIVAALVIGGAWCMWAQQQAQSSRLPASISMKKAAALPKNAACLANNETARKKAQSQPSLGEDGGFWTSYIYDVPAGTRVDVNIATINDKGAVVTGSLAYSDTYGHYNFTATKETDGWRYTQFTGCK